MNTHTHTHTNTNIHSQTYIHKRIGILLYYVDVLTHAYTTQTCTLCVLLKLPRYYCYRASVSHYSPAISPRLP